MEYFNGDFEPKADSKENYEKIYTLDISDYIIPYNYLTPSEYILGMKQNEEKYLRFYFGTFINEIGAIMKLRQTNILTSLKIFNYIFWKIPFTKYNPFYIIITSIFLGSKIEENQVNLKDLINVALYVFYLHRKENNLKKKYPSEEVNKIKDAVLLLELIILKELGYNLSPFSDHPHKYLLHFLKKIKNDLNLFNKAWAYLNDMYLSSLVVNYSNYNLVCAAIFYASRFHFIHIPSDVEWWTVFQTTFDQIEEISSELLRIYKENNKYNIIDVQNCLRKYSKNDKFKEKAKPRSSSSDSYSDYHRRRCDKNRERSRHRDRERYHRHSRYRKKSRSRSSHYRDRHTRKYYK